MASINVYETLYKNMKEKFTVVNDGCEYTLGEYMSVKAKSGLKKSKAIRNSDK